MNLSKSRYCRALQCKKILWLEKNKPEEMEDTLNDSVLEQGNMVHEVARYLFGEHINIEYTDNLQEMVNDTYSTIESYDDVIITEASFNYYNNFCSVDILVKKGNKYEIYEVKSSTKLKDVYVNDASYQYYVLTNLGLDVNKCSIIVINSDYERNGNIELDKLFSIYDITSDVMSLQSKVEGTINDINEYMKNEIEPNEEIRRDCFTPYDCPFFKYCTRNLQSPNVFDLGVKPGLKGLKYYQKGYITFNDLINAKLTSKERQVVEFNVYNKSTYIDKKSINEFLGTLSYPLYYLDFETYQMPIPLYDRVRPYEQVPFQYSLHYLINEDSKLEHKEFLASGEGDPRRKLAEQLIRDIPMNVCSLAYNMSFEKNVIKRLANIYPDLAEHLLNIYDNMHDLEVPFDKRYYYCKEMGSSSSIKKVLPALFPNDEELDYHNLDLIHNGSEAMDSYANLANMNSEDREYTRERLLRYCELDTYAMVKIHKKLKEVVNR